MVLLIVPVKGLRTVRLIVTVESQLLGPMLLNTSVAPVTAELYVVPLITILSPSQMAWLIVLARVGNTVSTVSIMLSQHPTVIVS